MPKIFFITHSVAESVVRYTIGKLYKTPENELVQNSTCIICGLVAMNFITITTPHLESSSYRQVSQHCILKIILFL